MHQLSEQRQFDLIFRIVRFKLLYEHVKYWKVLEFRDLTLKHFCAFERNVVFLSDYGFI